MAGAEHRGKRATAATRRRVRGALLLVSLFAGAGIAYGFAGHGQPSAETTVAAREGVAKARHGGRHANRADDATPSLPVLRLPDPLPSRSLRLLILTYHRIDRIAPGTPSITRTLTVTPAIFAAQMAALKRVGAHTVTQLQVWNALMHGRRLPRAPVLVTFDDAYRDVVTYAAPVIHRLHDHATAYVITDRLSHGRTSPWMLWTQLPQLERDGFDIGSHTVSHADLVAVGATAARIELRGSRFALQNYLGHPVQWLAYPYGRVDATVERVAEEAGYVLAVTTSGGVTQDATEPLLLHRYEATDDTSIANLVAILTHS
jgi:peptidoglycan/xylan/chitin deacetylase (PgdA/CDA1 family)